MTSLNVMTRPRWPANHSSDYAAQKINLKLYCSWSSFQIYNYNFFQSLDVGLIAQGWAITLKIYKSMDFTSFSLAKTHLSEQILRHCSIPT